MKKSSFISMAAMVLVVAGVGAAGWWFFQNRAAENAAPPAQPAQEPGVVSFPKGAPQLTSLSIAAIPTVPVPLAEPLNGRIAFDESYTARVSAPIAGRVLELRAQLGDTVAAGAALAVIDAPDLGSAQADLAKAKADENRKALSLRRANELFTGEVLPRKDLEASEADLAQAKAETERAALRLANLNPRQAPLAGQRMSIVSPISGVVADRKANPGMEVRPDLADPLFVVTDLKRVQVVVDLPEQYLGKVTVGQPVSVEVEAWANETFSGRVERIAPAVDPVTRRIQVRCTVDNSSAKLRPEMYARVRLLADEQKVAVRIPNSALITDGLYSFVFIERTPGVFVKTKVELAVQDRDFSYVASGITPENKVVVRGALLLNSELAGH
jgi:cobalt-zinc-cadmium efflux system membrane fusion protein